MAEHKWWHKQLRIIQYNLQLKDTGRMDPEKIAKETQDMGANAVVINVADSVVWYRTQVPRQKINPYLPEERDLFGELIDAFHAHDVKVFGRAMAMGFDEDTYYQQPQWAMRNPDGSPVRLGDDRPGEWQRFYMPCPNRGFIGESGMNVGVEAFSKYDLDGAFWIGGLGDNNCWCSHCRKLYRKKYGVEMPNDPKTLHPDWINDNRRKLEANIMRQILKVKPDIPYLHYYLPFTIPNALPAIDIIDMDEVCNALCTEVQDMLSSGRKNLPIWHEPTMVAKLGRTLEDYPPPMMMVHTCPGMDWRHTCMPEPEFLYWSAQVAANGASFWTSFTGFGDTIPDKRIFNSVRTFNRMVEKIEDDMFAAKGDCQIMLLSDGGEYVKGWAEALICSHMDFDMLAHYQLTYERIKDYPVVIVPKGYAYDAAAGEVFAAYVCDGGHLIIEGTEERELQHVRGLLGVEGDIVCSEDLFATYLRIEPAASGIQAGVGATELVPLRGKVGFCNAVEGATVLATWVPPFASARTAGRPPERASLPIAKTNVPLCTVSEYGAGRVMFLSYEPSRLIREYALQDMFTTMAGYVEYMLGQARQITIKAPYRVISTVFKKDNTQMIHFINGIGQRPLLENIPVHDIELSVKLCGRQVESVTSCIEDAPVSFEVKDDILHIALERLTIWNMLRIQYR